MTIRKTCIYLAQIHNNSIKKFSRVIFYVFVSGKTYHTSYYWWCLSLAAIQKSCMCKAIMQSTRSLHPLEKCGEYATPVGPLSEVEGNVVLSITCMTFWHKILGWLTLGLGSVLYGSVTLSRFQSACLRS